MEKFINVALPKGRLGEEVYELLEKAGFDCPEIKEESRKLIFEAKSEKEDFRLRLFWVKPSDVVKYVERGVADAGIAGKDVIEEYEPDVYELMDLELGKCRMCVAGPADFEDDGERALRVATKFPRAAKEFYRSRGRDIDVIKLHGSIELAPILGLSDVIVDIVQTGSTLKENDLAVLCEIFDISARLIANKASFKFKRSELERLRGALREELNARKAEK